MSESVSPSLSTMRPQVACERIRAFAEQFGSAHLVFAQHVADLLLSALCEKVSHELYEMDVVLRAELLAGLKGSQMFGPQHLGELSSFLLDAVGRQLHSSNLNVRRLARSQRWTALGYVQPGQLAQELRATLESLTQNDRGEHGRLRALIETLHLLVEPLATDDTFSCTHKGKGIKLLERSNCATIQGDRAPGLCHRRLAMRHPLARPGSRLPGMSKRSMDCCQRGEEQWRNQ